MKLLLKIFAICIIGTSAISQNSILLLPPRYFNPSSNNLPTPNYPNAFNGVWPDPTPGAIIGAHNAYKNNSNDPLFFYIDGVLYNENGYYIDRLSSNYLTSGLAVEGWSESCIVPNPANCKQYYIFTSDISYQNGFAEHLPYFALIDVSQNNPNGPNGELGKNITPNQIPGNKTIENLYVYTNTPPVNSLGDPAYNGDFHYAATQEINGYRLLFVANNDEILVYKISNNSNAPIVFLSSLITSTLGILQPANAILGLTSREVNKTELELYEDPLNNRIKIAVGVPQTSAPNFTHNYLLLAEYDYNGNMITNSAKAVSARPGGAPPKTYFYGVEFSPDGNWVYFTHTKHTSTYTDPIEAVNFSNPNIRYAVQAAGVNMGDFEKSQIEITPGGDLVLATNNRLASISNANNPAAFVWNNNLNSLNNYPLQFPNTVFGFPNQNELSTYVLPDQIDQEVYGNFFFSSVECCKFYTTYDQFNFISAQGIHSWVGTNNPLNNNSGNIVTIGNELRIPAGSDVTITGMTIKFAPGAKFIVENGNGAQIAGRLTLLNCTLTVDNRCENKMWAGVQVLGDIFASHNSINQGILNAQGTTIEHAYIAVQAGDYSNNTMGGAQIQILNNCTIQNNERGIVFTKTSPNNMNTSRIRLNTFQTTQNLLEHPTITPISFIEMDETNNIIIQGNIFQNSVANFDWQYDGIISKSSRYFVNKYKGAPNYFRNLHYGIYASSPTGNLPLFADGNQFENNIFGIYLNRVDNVSITNNNFRLSNLAPLIPFKFRYGIYVDMATGFKIQDNSFSRFVGQAPLVGITNGIVVNNSGANPNLIYRNNFIRLAIGIQAQEINYGTLQSGIINDFGLKYYCNALTAMTQADFTTPASMLGNAPGIAHYQGDLGNSTNFKGSADNLFSYTNLGTAFDFFQDANALSLNYYFQNIPNQNPQTFSNNVYPQVVNFSYGCPLQFYNYKLSNVEGSINVLVSNNKNSQDSLNALIDANQTSALLAQIQNNKPASALFPQILQNAPYISNAVLTEILNSNNYSKQEKKQLLIAASPLTLHMKEVIEQSDLPRGYKNQISNAQTGNCKMEEIYSLLSQCFSNQVQLYDEMIRYFYEDTLNNNSKTKAEFYLKTRANLFINTARPKIEASLNSGDSLAAGLYLDTLIMQEGQNSYTKLKEKQLQKIHGNFKSDLIQDTQLKNDILLINQDSTESYSRLQSASILNYIGINSYTEPIYEISFPQNGNRYIEKSEEAILNDFTIKAFPNPIKQNELINFSTTQKLMNVKIQLINALGEICQEQEFSHLQHGSSFALSSGLKGMYFMIIYSDQSIINKQKIFITD